MPDFVGENSLNASELEAQLAKAKEDNKKHIIEDAPERKSLYEQLKESKEKKQLDYQKLLETQNSSYKLDEKSAKFYAQLKNEEIEREDRRKKEESEKLNLFRNLKKARQHPTPKTLSSTSGTSAHEIPTKSSIIIRKRKNEINPEAAAGTMLKKGRDSKIPESVPIVNSSNADYGNNSYKKPDSTQPEIRHDKKKLTNVALQGLGDYTSSDEE